LAHPIYGCALPAGFDPTQDRPFSSKRQEIVTSMQIGLSGLA
jgi:hypothetical protein